MFYIYQTEKWIDDVVKSMNEKQLKPENSQFMIVFFSSMDYELVDYFKTHKKQISSYSGNNFHIFTPFIFEDNLISDNEMGTLAYEFSSFGIPIKAKPTFIFFKLQKTIDDSYEPNFFGGFELSTFQDFHEKLKEIIYYATRINDTRELEQKLTHIFGVKNLITNYSISSDLKQTITHKLPKAKIFISHSSTDKPFVRKLISTLSDNDMNFWIDEKEIQAGDDIQKSISKNLKGSSYLLAIISKNSVNSKWVTFELSQFMGFANNQNIIPILIDKGQKFSEPIDNLLSRLKYLDFSDEANWNKNIEELKHVLKKQ